MGVSGIAISCGSTLILEEPFRTPKKTLDNDFYDRSTIRGRARNDEIANQ